MHINYLTCVEIHGEFCKTYRMKLYFNMENIYEYPTRCNLHRHMFDILQDRVTITCVEGQAD